jgi:hypothetical protein
MPLPQFKITKKKDGREVAWFRDTQGRVRTGAGMTATSWTRAEQIKQLADYGIVLQIAQARAGLGANGSPMPPLKGSTHAVFVASVNGRARFTRKTYADWKAAHGLQPIRDLYGAGKGGHMLEDIRINYLDDKRATVAITSKLGRDKARGNEKRAAWWGWSPDSIRKMREVSAQIFHTGAAERLFELGLIGVSALAFVKAKYLRRVA